MGKKHKQHKRHSASGGAPASPHVETPGSAPPASLPVSISLHSRGKQPPPKPPREPRPHAAKPHPLAIKPLRIPMQSIHFEEAAAVKPLVISSSGRQLKANDRDIPVEFKIVIPRAFYECAVLAKQRAEFGRLEGEGSVRGGGGEEEGRREHRSHKHKKHQKRRHGEDSEPTVLAPHGAPSAPSPLPPPLPHSSVHATPSHPATLPPPTVTHAASHDHKHKKHKHKKHRTHAHSTEQAPLEHRSHSTEQGPVEHHSTEQAPLEPHRVRPHPIKQAPLGPTDYGFLEPRPPLPKAPPHSPSLHSSSLHTSLSLGSHKQAKKKKKKHKHSHEPTLPPLTLHTSPLTPSPTLRTLTSHGHGHPPSKHRRDDQPPLPKQPRLDLPKATPPQIHSTPSEPPLRRHSDRESEGGKRWREGSHKQDKRGGEEGGGERWAVVGEIRRDEPREAKTRRETPQRPLTKPARAASHSSLSPTSPLTLHPSHSPASPLTPLPSHSPRQPLTSQPTAKPLAPHPSHSPAPPLTPHPSHSSTQPLTPLPSHSPRHPLPSHSSNAASKESGSVEGTEGVVLAIPSPPLPSHPHTPLKSSQLKLISKVTLRNFLKHLHSQISKRDSEGVFGEAVTDDIAPNYSKIISQPMDLSLIRSKVEGHQYPSVNEFRMDFELMCGNAMTYNAPETLYYASAKKLLGAGLKIISKETAVRPDIRYGTIGPAPSRSDTASPQPQPPPPLPPPPPEFHLPPPTSSVLLDYSSPFLIRIDVAPLILHSTKPPPPPPHPHTVTESPLLVADERIEVAGGVEGVKSGTVEVEVPDQSFLTRMVVGVESEEEEGEVCGGEGVLVEARAAAEAAKENLDANQPDSHAAFLKRDREAQRTLLSFINPDSGEDPHLPGGGKALQQTCSFEAARLICDIILNKFGNTNYYTHAYGRI